MAAKQEEDRDINKGTENQATVTGIVMLDSDGSSENHVDCEGGAKTGGACIGSSCSSSALRPIPPFLLKIYDMLGNNETNSIVSWNSTGTSFLITNPHSFAANVLPIYFRHRNFQSFVTQLNSYGFRKISWEQWEYRNDNFQKGERHLLRNIKRRNQQLPQRIQPFSETQPSLSTSSCSTNAEKELEITMKEHDRLKLEITKLKEKQETLEQKLASLKNQAICNRNDQQRIMLAAKKIIRKQRDPTPTPDEKNLNGKRNIKEKSPLMCTDIVEMISKQFCREGKMVLDEKDQVGKDQSNTLISLEDLIGESSDWVEYVRELQEKASHIKT